MKTTRRWLSAALGLLVCCGLPLQAVAATPTEAEREAERIFRIDPVVRGIEELEELLYKEQVELLLPGMRDYERESYDNPSAHYDALSGDKTIIVEGWSISAGELEAFRKFLAKLTLGDLAVASEKYREVQRYWGDKDGEITTQYVGDVPVLRIRYADSYREHYETCLVVLPEQELVVIVEGYGSDGGALRGDVWKLARYVVKNEAQIIAGQGIDSTK